MELKDKITRYWITLYPEVKQMEQMDSILKNTLGEGIEELLERIENNRFYGKDDSLKMIEDIFSLPIHKELLPFEEKNKSQVMYYNFFRPIVNYCFWKYYDRLKKESEDFNFDYLIMNCLEDISKYAVKMLVLDINYMKKAGLLQGETSEERYAYYENEILSDKDQVRELYENYYEFVRIAKKMTDASSDYCIEILTNFTKNREQIQQKLHVSNREVLKIDCIKIGSGDKHNGKSVAQVLLSNEMQILYKPHSLALDKAFYDLIGWINAKKSDTMLDMRASDVLSYDDYAWTFYIQYEEAKTLKGINRYFQRGGQLLGLMYALNAVDCHYENIIANGEYPVLIDTETIMHPIINGHENESISGLDVIQNLTQEHLNKSVLTTGLLPLYIVGGGIDAERVDVSGFSNLENKRYPFKSIKLVNEKSDDVKLERNYQEIQSGKNCPIYKGKKYEGYMYEKDIIKGYRAMYEWILEHKEEMLSYIKEHFRNMHIRILMRATNIYGRLLETSMHPDFLSDDISRRVLLSRIGINITKEYENITPLECSSLVENDIPYFTCSFSRNEISCNGQVRDGMIKEAPIETIEKKFTEFSEKDLQQQIHYIRMGYRLKESKLEADISNLKFAKKIIKGKVIDHTETYIDFAEKVADYLIKYSLEYDIDGQSNRSWVTSTLIKMSDQLSDVTFGSYNLYGGIGGIGLFLLELAKVTSKDTYKQVARECVRSIQYKIHELQGEELLEVGNYNGIAGHLLLLYDASKYFKELELNRDIEILLQLMERSIPYDQSFDVMQGSAGCMQVLHYMLTNGYLERDKCVSILGMLVDHLYQKLYVMKEGRLVWIGARDLKKYSGYAHGVAGVIAQLADVREILDTPKIDRMIESALVFERSFYSEELGNWFINENRNETGNGWCHGSPGILLEKCSLLESGYQDELIAKEVRIALENTLSYSIGCTNCYCHGDIGNLDIIYRAAVLLNSENLLQRCKLTYDKCLTKSLQKKYDGRAFRGGDVVGLMLGSAGFGYSALRFARPKEVKSLLSLNCDYCPGV